MGRDVVTTMGLAQRQKGKRGEREVASIFRAAGYTVRRGQQADGPVVPDIVVDGMPWLWVEIGHGAKMDGRRKLAQAQRDACIGRPGAIPVAITKRDRERKWTATWTQYLRLETPGCRPAAIVVQADLADFMSLLPPPEVTP